jgi:hypothetical protein
MPIAACLVDTNILLRIAKRIAHILTLNDADFTRFKGVVAVNPRDL